MQFFLDADWIRIRVMNRGIYTDSVEGYRLEVSRWAGMFNTFSLKVTKRGDTDMFVVGDLKSCIDRFTKSYPLLCNK